MNAALKITLLYTLIFSFNSRGADLFDQIFDGDNCLKTKTGSVRRRVREKIEWGVYTELQKYGFKNIDVGFAWINQKCRGSKYLASYNIWASADCYDQYCRNHQRVKIMSISDHSYYYKIKFSYWDAKNKFKKFRDVKLGYIK